MQNIVRDLLVLANLEGDMRPPGDDLLDMRAVLRHLEDDAEISGGRHRITFHTDEALTVAGAKTEIVSALGNLVMNAIRYTPDGGTIDVTWQRVQDRAVFSVRDSGLGIPAEHIPR